MRDDRKPIYIVISGGAIVYILFLGIFFVGIQKRIHHIKWIESRVEQCIYKKGHLVYNPFYPENHACAFGDEYRALDSKGF